MDITAAPANQAELLAQFKAIASEINKSKDTDAAHTKAAEDFANRLRAIEEKSTFANAREAVPVGGVSDLIARTMVDGKIRLRAGTIRSTFAGMPVDVEVDGIFDGAPATPWDAELKRLALGRTLYRHATGRPTPKIDSMIRAHVAKAPTAGGFRNAIEKAISDTAGSGAEWIPDIPISTLFEDFYTPNGIAALFPTINVNGPVLIPSITDTFRPYLKGKVTTDDPSQYTASTPTTASTTIDPVGFAVRSVLDDAATEDAIFPILPEIQRRMGRAVADAYEDCMVNGDTTATHEDTINAWNIRSRWGATGLGGTADHRRGFKGLRRLAVDSSTTVDLTASQTVAGVMGSVVSLLGERAASEIVLITSPEVLYKKLMVDTNVLTVDKAGPALATWITGQLASIGGHPLVVSRWMSADLNASGIFDNVTKTKSGLLAVDRSAFNHYQVRAALVETEKDITRGAYNVVGTLRRTFRTLSSQAVSAFAYNML
jgi:hypothetical protein